MKTLFKAIVGFTLLTFLISPPAFAFGAAPVSDTQCGGGFDSKKVATCGFGAERTRVKARGDKCVDEIKTMLCQESMWASLGLQERIQRVTRLAMKHAAARGVDFRALPCIIRRESIWFDPAIVTFMTCSATTTDQGLGQAVYTTFKDLVERYGFKSKIAPFDKAPYTTDSKLLFEAMGLSAELQVEVTTAILALKLQRANGDYKTAFANYNGSKDKVAYGEAVGACFTCTKVKMDSGLGADRQAGTNIDECLDQAMAGNGVEYSFAKFKHDCNHDGDAWKWDYWVQRGVDPASDPAKYFLDPKTKLPFPPGTVVPPNKPVPAKSTQGVK